ncbi:MAG: porin [Spirosomataceae bacterium]
MKILKFVFICLPFWGLAQDKSLTISGFADIYYGYDFSKPINNSRPNFLYNHSRNNEVNVNLAFLKATYQNDKVRANIALGIGTYMQYNYAAEPNALQHIFEANVGVKLGKNTWLDAGILPSHIGFESAISKDCWTLSRSILAENSPYFETGVKVTNSPSDKLTFSVMLLNGWQRITRVEGNSTPAFGTQLTFKPNDKTTLNWSTFVGNDKPDESRQMRYFNNFYAIFQASKRLGFIAGFDYGVEQKSYKNTKYNTWLSPVLIAKLQVSEKWNLAGRAEYYKDANGVIIAANINEFDIVGFSLNADYQIFNNVVWRIEARSLNTKKSNFNSSTDLRDNNFSALTSLAISF